MATPDKPNKDAQQILEYARLWFPFDGGEASDIFVNFGLTKPHFYRRVLSLLKLHPQHFDAPTTSAVAHLAQRVSGPARPAQLRSHPLT